MRQVFDKITFLSGSPELLEEMPSLPSLRPFDPKTIDFLDEVSARIRKLENIRSMPDAAAFGFWCGRSSLARARKEIDGDFTRSLGRGLALHFAPSNIPLLFAFSMAASLLAGCPTAVRLPSKETGQERVVIGILNEVRGKFPEYGCRIALFRYAKDPEITDALSAMCDVRVIWGGDSSVSEIRRSPLPPLSYDITFADRSSAALIESRAVLETENLTSLAKKFYNDTYQNDQNACSAPRILFWAGSREDTTLARERFWKAVREIALPLYEVPPVTAVNKYAMELRMAADGPGSVIEGNDNVVNRVWMDTLPETVWDYTAPGGLFIESGGKSPDGMLPILTKHCQTICCYGKKSAELLSETIARRGIRGVDRLVPIGRALDFSLVWDGHDLIRAMSRKITIM